MEAPRPEEGIVVNYGDTEILAQLERKLIKEGDVVFETEDIRSTRTNVLEVVKKHKAYVSADEEFNSSGRESSTLTIRVPAESFDQLLNEATSGVDKFERKEITVKDVTEEFLDVQARLKTKKELEARFLELLKEAKKVPDVLEIETQLGQLRSDIESVEGRLKYLESRVSLSTLTMTFYETVPTTVQFGQKFRNGFSNGWDNLIWFFVFLTNIWPFILLAFGLIIGLKLRRKKQNN
ncbi:MAG: DUF4349 domain-containing protein [Flavobacteriales bacterium]|nr:DUF4349 domain-containing protein [Flavobacteriales bacterium]